jgi:hypothetical protein
MSNIISVPLNKLTWYWIFNVGKNQSLQYGSTMPAEAYKRTWARRLRNDSHFPQLA